MIAMESMVWISLGDILGDFGLDFGASAVATGTSTQRALPMHCTNHFDRIIFICISVLHFESSSKGSCP